MLQTIAAEAATLPTDISTAISSGLGTTKDYVISVIGTALPIVLGVVGLGVAAVMVVKWVKKIKG
ncbi:MAG: hypothetical protein SPH20_04950 [Eubacterium sp.]|nr:hypothetical protein [Eubacterium sp.]